jgi:hypothetical protein
MKTTLLGSLALVVGLSFATATVLQAEEQAAAPAAPVAPAAAPEKKEESAKPAEKKSKKRAKRAKRHAAPKKEEAKP